MSHDVRGDFSFKRNSFYSIGELCKNALEKEQEDKK